MSMVTGAPVNASPVGPVSIETTAGLDRVARAGELSDGDHVLLLAAGTGYTWAATVVRWGPVV